MTTAEAIVAVLLADSGVTSLASTRIFPLKMPQGALQPAVVYTIVSEVPEDSLVSSAGKIANARIQLDCYARTYLGAHALADAVSAAIGDLSAPSPGLCTWSGSSTDLYDDASELYRVLLEISAWR